MKIDTQIQSQYRIKEQIRNRIIERKETHINLQDKNKTETNVSNTTELKHQHYNISELDFKNSTRLRRNVEHSY